MFGKLKSIRIALTVALALMVGSLQAQTISGNVKDANGEPVIGATIMESGTKNGTVTDFDGNFTIKLQQGGNLDVTYIGMKPQKIKTAGKTNVNITLEDDNTTLSDVVVVGYGTMKRSDLTGSVSSVNTEQLNAKGAPSVMENLQGSTPGVNITMSGRVGDSPTIEIRGKSSINSDTKPLFVVDGVFCDDIDWLNPQDIEKIDVLKDASSTAIYGSRATAGVVMVTTKSGATVAKDQKATISYDGYFGWTKAAHLPEFMSSKQFKDFRTQKFLTMVNSGTNTPVYGVTVADGNQGLLLRQNGTQDYALVDLYNRGVDFDWPREITRGGTQQNHYLAVNGSSKGVAYNFGLGYNAEKGIYQGDDSKKVNFKGSIDSQVTSFLKAGFSFNASYGELSQTNGDAISAAFRMTAFSEPYMDNGELWYQPGYVEYFGTQGTDNNFTKTVNPLLKLKNNENDQQTWRFLGNAYLQAEPIKGLTIRTVFSPNYKSTRKGDYTGFINPARADQTGNARYYDEDSSFNTYGYLYNQKNFQWTWDNTVTYTKRFNDLHNINVMALYSVQRETTEYQRTGAKDLNEDILWWNLNAGEILGKYDPDDSTLKTYGLRNYYSTSSMSSWALRANYSFMDRYLLTATVRWDGSSRFAKDNRWGSFPSVAFAWRASEEEFIKKINWISNLKLRISYGVTGNCSGIDNYATLANRSEGVIYPFGGVISTGYTAAAIVDKDLKWEKSGEFNLGIDFGFLKNRIMGSIDFYSKTSKDLLYQVQLPLVAGGQKMYTNIGKVRNTGVEISLTTVNVKKGDWEWTTTYNFSHNKNEVKDINGMSDKIIHGDNPETRSLFVGYSVNNVYGYDWDGIVTNQNIDLSPEQQALYKTATGRDAGSSMRSCDFYGDVYGWKEGAAIIRDINNDGKFDDNDKKVWSADPVWTGSFTSNLSWKNWDLGINVYAKVNYKVKSNFYGRYALLDQRGQQGIKMDYYIPAGTLISFDGINADGTYVNPVYQEQTHYGDYPVMAGTSGTGMFGFTPTQWNDAMTYVNGTYVKVKNITLGYTFPKKWLTPWGCSHLRLYFTVTNPIIISGYKGFDPEWANASLSKDVPSTVGYQIGASIKF